MRTYAVDLQLHSTQAASRGPPSLLEQGIASVQSVRAVEHCERGIPRRVVNGVTMGILSVNPAMEYYPDTSRSKCTIQLINYKNV